MTKSAFNTPSINTKNSAFGVMVIGTDDPVDPRINPVLVDVTGLSSGHYILTIQCNIGVSTTRFVKTN